MRPLYFKQKGEVELVKLTAAPELKGLQQADSPAQSSHGLGLPQGLQGWAAATGATGATAAGSGALACGMRAMLAAVSNQCKD